MSEEPEPTRGVEFTPPVPQPREYVGPGLLLGLAAWVVVYAVVLGLSVGLAALGTLEAGGTASTVAVGGWLFYAAHLGLLAMAGLSPAASVVADVGGLAYVLVLVPPVVLAAAASLAVARVGVPGPVEGAKGGAAVALGYVAPSLAGVAVLDGTAVVAGTTYPLFPGLSAALLVGLVYPAVVGALGGALSAR